MMTEKEVIGFGCCREKLRSNTGISLHKSETLLGQMKCIIYHNKRERLSVEAGQYLRIILIVSFILQKDELSSALSRCLSAQLPPKTKIYEQ